MEIMKARTKQSQEKFPETGTNWQQLYVITENWQSDILFFEDEIVFFRSLMSRYVLQLLEDIDKTQLVTGGLKELEEHRQLLIRKVKRHLRHLSDHFSSPFVLADPAYLDEHRLLEAEIVEFVKKFRNTKRLVFKHMDQILKTEKGKHLITNL